MMHNSIKKGDHKEWPSGVGGALLTSGRLLGAAVTRSIFVNEYHWGNLKGDPLDWMRRHFDAHIYVANWCSCWLFLRVPKDAFDAKMLNAFETESAFTVDQTGSHWILEWGLSESQDYDRFGDEDGRGWMGRMT